MRRINSDRAAGAPYDYFWNMDGASAAEKRAKMRELRIRPVREVARTQEFQSILHAGLEEAEDSPETIRTFVNSGGYERLGILALKVRRQTPEYREKLCATAQSLYSTEWKKLTGKNIFKTPLRMFNPETVSSFSISGLFESFRQIAPCFINLLNHLASLKRRNRGLAKTPDTSSDFLVQGSEEDEYEEEEDKEEAEEEEEEGMEAEDDEEKNQEDDEEGGNRVTFTKAQKKIRKRERAIVVVVSVLANETTNRFNAIQAIVGFLLYASKVPKRVIAILNHLGVSVSYSGIRDAVRANGKALRDRLRRLGAIGEAFWFSYDNCTQSHHTRDDTVHHKTSYETSTVGYAVRPADSRARPMFTHADRDYGRVKDLSSKDILPDAADHNHMSAARRVLIYDVVRAYAKRGGVKVPQFGYVMPQIYQLDPRERSEIIGLPVKNLDEGQINDTIQILYEFQADMGMSSEQLQDKVINVKGDFATVRNARFEPLLDKVNNRRGVVRQSKCKPHAQLNYVEATAGLFHLQVHVLAMLFEAHLGKENDRSSMSRWIKKLDKEKLRLWNKQRKLVKDFRSCQMLWDTILDGCIMAAIIDRCGFDSIELFLAEGAGRAELFQQAIESLADDLGNLDKVETIRQRPDEGRDRAHENFLLYLQQGLVLRNYIQAMREGDSGRVQVCLSFFTVWFQATKKHNYRNETIHLSACLKKLWSEDMKKFWLDNCLINPSGKAQGFMACDYLCEYVVREIKNMMRHNINDITNEFLNNIIAPQVLFFRDVRKKVAEETDAPTYGFHSSPVERYHEVTVVARLLLRDGVPRFTPGREEGEEEAESEATDLFWKGMMELLSTTQLQSYVDRTERLRTFEFEIDLEGDRLSEDIDIGWDTTLLPQASGAEWL